MDDTFNVEVVEDNGEKNTTVHLPQENNKKSVLLEIDPQRCIPWKYHNRDSAWLTKKRCEDLIFSIQKNGQVEPALIRNVRGNPRYDFEIICGVRRWFACSQIPNQKLLAYVTEANDKTCMIFMHAENADSKDISEFERAFSFAQQLKSGVFKNQIEMAEALGITQGYISKMVNAAEIFEFEWIRNLFKSKLDIPVKHAYTLSILLKKADTYNLIKKEADFLLKDNESANENIPASRILKRLIYHAKAKPQFVAENIILTVNNKPIISCKQNKMGKHYLLVEREVNQLRREEVEKACIQALKEYILDPLFPGE